MFKKSLITMSITFLLTQLAWAGGETPVSDGLNYFINAMYGTTGVTIATLAVMLVGLLCLGHVFRWIVLGYTVIGISIIFGSGAIVNSIVSMIHTT